MKIATNKNEIKKSIKQTYFLLKYGMSYFSLNKAIASKTDTKYKKGVKHILWIGAFPARHKNVGDHAQTVAVKYFFEAQFKGYKVIRLDRNEAVEQWREIESLSKKFTKDDILIIHSSGDFGSQHYKKEGCWHETRRNLVKLFPQCKSINLPTTVMYSKDEFGQSVLEEDKTIFSMENFALLCREEVSLSMVKDKINCKTIFFPDFVFYLQRKESEKKRKGVLVVLRSDSEANLNDSERKALIQELKRSFGEVTVADILNAKFPVVKGTEDQFVSHIQDVYEEHELVVTDRMHGMILAVTTNTPCLALDSGIPHKINAYRSFLDGAVKFHSGSSFDEQLFKDAIEKRTPSPDLSHFYNSFKEELL